MFFTIIYSLLGVLLLICLTQLQDKKNVWARPGIACCAALALLVAGVQYFIAHPGIGLALASGVMVLICMAALICWKFAYWPKPALIVCLIVELAVTVLYLFVTVPGTRTWLPHVMVIGCMMGFWGVGKRTGAVWANPMAALSGLVGTVMIVMVYIFGTQGATWERTLAAAGDRQLEAMAEVTGQYLSGKKPRAKIILVYAVGADQRAADFADVLTEQGEIKIVHRTAVSASEPLAVTNAVMESLTAAPGADYLVAMTGLPTGLLEKFWERRQQQAKQPGLETPKVVLVGETVDKLEALLDAELLQAVITLRPGVLLADPRTGAPLGLDRAAAELVLVIDKDSIAETKREYRGLVH